MKKIAAALALIVIVPLIFIIVISSRPFTAAACEPTQPVDLDPGTGDVANPVLDRVVAISVDGLSTAALARLGAADAPNIHDLLDEGASTLNARTMVEQTLTLPNHVSMLTGRRITKSAGGHGVTWNTDRTDGPTVQQAAGGPVASVFSVAADSGTTALFSTKAKFSIFKQSWPESISRTGIYDLDDNRVAQAAATDLRHAERAFTFVHLGLPDETGHRYGWSSPRYLAAVRRTDALVGQLVDAARSSSSSSTGVILTADHGGHGGPAVGHDDPTDPANYTIPFAVTGPGITAGDLYDLNPDYRDPRRAQPGYDGTQPVRNGDVANLALSLLGLRTVPGSVFGVDNTLNVAETADAASSGTGDIVNVAGVGSQASPTLLTQIRFAENYPTMTNEQANNAISIAQVARELDVPAFGLQIAIATAIQESKLMQLDGGDRDSLSLFQQRPSQGWGTPAQIMDPLLATRAFFGRAEHTDNPGLLDVPGWEQMSLTAAAQAVQRSGFPDAYAQWEGVAGEIAAALGAADLPAAVEIADPDCLEENGLVGPITLASFNILGAGHTDGRNGGRGLGSGDKKDFAAWNSRLPQALGALEERSVTVAGLQEVHPPQENALATRYADQWGMYPKAGKQNKVIWDRAAWKMTDARLVAIPYFNGKPVGMPLVQLTSTSTGQAIWIWSIHNPIGAKTHRVEALRRQLETMDELKASGLPVFLVGDFNDGRDAAQASHCVLTPTLTNAFGGSTDGACKPPKSGARIDHIYGANTEFASARVDASVQSSKISDHPLVTATTAGTSGCPPTGSAAEEGLQPDGLLTLRSVNAQFGPHTYLGVGDRSTNPDSDHPAGRAVDIMIDNWATETGAKQGTRIAEWVRSHAAELGVTYVIWRARIWSLGDPGWRPYNHPSGQSNPTLLHMDHVHVSVEGSAGTRQCDSPAAGQVVYPVPPNYISADNHNWHEVSSIRSSWHTGTDFSVPCGTPVLAAHGGTIEIETDQSWAGPWLVKVTTGPEALTTWYAHMQKLTVTPGQTVQPGQQIGEVGDEGNSTGCHLHFEVHLENGSIYGPDNVDPSVWLAQQTKSTRV